MTTERNIIELNKDFSSNILKHFENIEQGSAEYILVTALMRALSDLEYRTIDIRRHTKRMTERVSDMNKHGRLVSDADWLQQDVTKITASAELAKAAEKCIVHNIRVLKAMGWLMSLDTTDAYYVNKF